MPPKDIKAGRMNGRYAIFTESGYQPLGEVQEVEITEETATFADTQEPIIKAANPGELTGTLKGLSGAFTSLSEATEIIVDAWNRLWETLNPMLARLAKDPRTPKLVHLAKHGKNRRIRKKNAKRLIRIMKGE